MIRADTNVVIGDECRIPAASYTELRTESIRSNARSASSYAAWAFSAPWHVGCGTIADDGSRELIRNGTAHDAFADGKAYVARCKPEFILHSYPSDFVCLSPPGAVEGAANPSLSSILTQSLLRWPDDVC